MSSSKFGSHMQTLIQTQRMDHFEQEVHELRGVVTTLRAEVEKLTNLVLLATKDPLPVQERPQPPYQSMCMQQPRQQAPQQLVLQNQAWKTRPQQFDPIPVKYATLLPILLKKNLVQTRPPPRVRDPLPLWYHIDHTCVFHQGTPGHDTEQCYALRGEVQKLIKNKVWSFEDPDVQVLLKQTSHPVDAVMPIMNDVQSSGHQPQFQQYQQQPRRRASGQPQFDMIPMKYAELLPVLLEMNIVQTRPHPRVPTKLPAGYRSDLFCVFHQGAPGHDIEQCFAFRTAVQKLIQDKALPFLKLNSDIQVNPLSNLGA